MEERANGSAGSAASASGTADSSSLGSLDAGETCAYMSPSPYTGCRMPRSCQSCLMTSGCMINEAGTCVSTQDEAPDPALDYQLALAEGLALPNATASGAALSLAQMWQFPAGRVKYCSMSDRVCAQCTRANFWRSRGTSPDSRFCVGEDGACVCVDVCERRWFVQQDCSAWRGMYLTATPAPSNARAASTTLADTSFVNRAWHAMVGSIVFVVVVLFAVVWSRRRTELHNRQLQREREARHQARRERRREARSAQLGVNSLSLSGWDAYRRDLIEKEIAQLAGVPETRVESVGAHEVIGDSDGDSDDDDGSDGDRDRTGSYVRMRGDGEAPVPAATNATDAENVGRGNDDDNPTTEQPRDAPERSTQTLAPLSVSPPLQPRR